MDARLATARPHFHVDVNVGDPIVPAPVTVRVTRLRGGVVTVRGYPLAMVHAEKIVTAIARGTVSTRWRDFADMCLLARRHAVDDTELTDAIRAVALHRQVQLVPLAGVLDGYGDIGQRRWAIWRRRQRLDDRLPESFGEVVDAVIDERPAAACTRARTDDFTVAIPIRSRRSVIGARPARGQLVARDSRAARCPAGPRSTVKQAWTLR